MKNFLEHIQLGTYLEALIHILTLGYGTRVATFISVDILGFSSCGCCSRKQYLNRLTNPRYEGNCKGVRLFN
jgi:hypothetical protein